MEVSQHSTAIGKPKVSAYGLTDPRGKYKSHEAFEASNNDASGSQVTSPRILKNSTTRVNGPQRIAGVIISPFNVSLGDAPL